MINKSIIVYFLFMTVIGNSQVSLLKEINFVLSDELNTVPESNSNSDENVPSFAEEDSCCIDSSLVISELLEGNKKELLQESVLSDGITPIFRSANNYDYLNSYKKSHLLDSTCTVLEWYPHWSRDVYKSYNNSLVFMILYFSYEVNEQTMYYKTVCSRREKALLDSAQKHQVKVLSMLTSLGHNKNHTLLSNKVALRNFINTSITINRDGEAHELPIYFEEING